MYDVPRMIPLELLCSEVLTGVEMLHKSSSYRHHWAEDDLETYWHGQKVRYYNIIVVSDCIDFIVDLW
jgi:hypothetical protein